MKIDKVSGYFLKNDNGRQIRIMYMDYRWHFIINDDSVFSFSEDDAKEFADLFNEINRSSNVTDLKVWKDIDNVFSGVSTFSFKGNNNQVIADLVANLFNEISKSRDVKELYIGYENR